MGAFKYSNFAMELLRKRPYTLLLLLLHTLVMLVTGQQELQVKWKESSDVVELTDPPEDLKKNGILVALVGESPKFNCSVDFAKQNIEIKFESSQNIHIKADNQIADQYESNFFLEKQGTVMNVVSDMDDATIQCKYDIEGGSGRSISMTLSVWNISMTTDAELCERANSITIEVDESKSSKKTEENVLNRIERKLNESPIGEGFTRNSSKFQKNVKCSQIVGEQEYYKNILKTISVNGKQILLTEFLKTENGEPIPPAKEGLGGGEIAGIGFGAVAVLGIIAAIRFREPIYSLIKTND